MGYSRCLESLTAIVGTLQGHVQVYRRVNETAAWFQLGPDFEGENAETILRHGNTVAFGSRSDDAFLNAVRCES